MDKNISLKTKLKLPRALILSIFLYTCEFLTLTEDLYMRITTVEVRSYRGLLLIFYRDYVTNEKVRKKIRHHSVKYDDLLTTLKKNLIDIININH